GRGKRVYLSDALVIMTSNLGADHFRRMTTPLGFRALPPDAARDVRSDVLRELERRFPPEFRNRIDDVVVFSPLAHGEVRQIALQYIARIEATLRERRRTIAVDEDAFAALVQEGHSLAYGARFLKRVIDDRVKLPISERWSEGTHFNVRLVD